GRFTRQTGGCVSGKTDVCQPGDRSIQSQCARTRRYRKSNRRDAAGIARNSDHWRPSGSDGRKIGGHPVSSAAAIPQAAIDRPLPLRIRADLEVAEQWFSGRRLFVIKDPLTLVYSYFTEHEHFILSALDGVRSIGEIQQSFHQRFAPQQVAPSQ